MAGRGLALSTARESAEKYVFRKSNTHFALVVNLLYVRLNLVLRQVYLAGRRQKCTQGGRGESNFRIKQILFLDLAGGFGSLEEFEVSPVDSD